MFSVVRSVALVSAATFGFVAAGEVRAASFFVQTTVEAAQRPFQDARSQVLQGSTPQAATDAAGYVSDPAASDASTTVSAGLGVLRSFSTASAAVNDAPPLPTPGPDRSAIGRAESLAIYSDTFFLSSSAQSAGTTGQLTADVLLDGVLSGDGLGETWRGASSWTVQITVNGQTYVYSRSRSGAPGAFPLGESGDPAGLVNPVFDVVFGQTNTVVMSLATAANAGVGLDYRGGAARSAGFTADFGSTLIWAGIGSLTVAGVEVADYAAVSPDTGFDFRAGYSAGPVPEPGTWALMIAGLGLVGLTVRRRGALSPI